MLNLEKNVTYEIVEPVTRDQVVFTPELEKTAKGANFIIYGLLTARSKISRKTLISILENTNAVELMDINMRSPFDNRQIREQFIKYVDIIKTNEEELNK